jgi:hypothetical protein
MLERFALLVPLLSVACQSHPLAEPVPAITGQGDQVFEVDPVRELDLLFLIDNSRSMAEEQTTLRENFPLFMRELAAIDGGLPDLHLAVISSDVGAGGLTADSCRPAGQHGGFLVKDGCGVDASREHFLAVAGERQNFTGDLASAFSCLANLGTGGCGYEHQLQAIRLALSDLNPQNAGFLRPEAHLAIVILTDEDDCSGDPDATLYDTQPEGHSNNLKCATLGHTCDGREVPAGDFSAPLASCRPFERTDAAARRSRLINVAELVAYVKALKPAGPPVIVASIMGWDAGPEARYRIGQNPSAQLDLLPVCDLGGDATAAPAVRIKSFVDAFEKGSWYTICQRSLAGPMERIGKEIAGAITNTCLQQKLADTDPAPGLQPDCVVTERRPGPPPAEVALPSCARGASPCWELLDDPTCPLGHRLGVRRSQPPPRGTKQLVKCLTAP